MMPETGIPWRGFWIPALSFAALSLLLASSSRLELRFRERLRYKRIMPWVVRSLVPTGVGLTGWALFRGYVAFLRYLSTLQDSGP